MPDKKKKSIQEFSASIKAKYPQYKDIEDAELVNKMIEKYPQYRDKVDFEKKDDAEQSLSLHPEGMEVPEQPQPEEGLESEEALGVIPMNEAELRVKMLRDKQAETEETALFDLNKQKGMSNIEAEIVTKAQKEKIQTQQKLDEAEGDITKTTEFWSERLDAVAGGEPLTLAMQEGRIKSSEQAKQLEKSNKIKREELIKNREAFEYRDFLVNEDDVFEADAIRGLEQLNQKIEDINKSSFSTEEKKKKITEYEARIADVNKKLEGITKDRERNINYKISELAFDMNESDSEEEKAEIKRKIDILESQKEIVFKPIETVTKEITDGEGVENVPGKTPQEKFNNYYDALYQEFDDLSRNEKIQSLLGQKGGLSELRSALTYGTGIVSDPKIDRFFTLQQKLENFAPVRLLNRYEAEAEEGGMLGFGKSLATSFGNFTTPINRQSDLEKSQDLYSTLKQTGVDIDKGIEAAAKKKEDGFESYGLSDPEFWGSTIGTSAALMSQMMGGGAVYKGTKLAKYLDKGEDVAKILSRRRYLDSLTKSKKIGKLFNNGTTKAISFGKKAASSAAAYEATGIIFEKAEDEANYMSGLYGSVGEQTLTAMFPQARRLTPIIRKMLGDNGFQKFITATVNKGSKVTGRGLGETAEEFMQEVSSIQREANGDFFEELENRFGTFDEAAKFVVSSFVMGAFMGGGEGAGAELQSGAKEALTKLKEQNPEQALKAQEAINFINSGSKEALNESVDETKVKGEYKVGKVNVPFSDIEEMVDAAETVKDLEGITVKNDQELEKRIADKYNELSKEVPSDEKVEPTEEAVEDKDAVEEVLEEQDVPPIEEKGEEKPVESEQKTEAKEETDAAKEEVVKAEPVDGSTVNLPPRIKGGVERTFQFDKGKWKQKVGGELSNISEDLQEELTNKFKGDEITEKPSEKEDKIQVPEETKASERVEEVVEEKIVKPKTKEEARKALKDKFKKKDKKEAKSVKEKPSKITWKKRKPGKPSSKITERVDPVQKSAEELAKGNITNAQYQEVLEKNTNREDITEVTEPATKEEVVNAVNVNKKEQVDLPIEEGSQVGIRPDIPSFFNKGTWVNTVHGKGKSGTVVSHEGATKVKNPEFHSSPKASLEIATKKKWDKDQKPQVWKEDKFDKKGKKIHSKGDVKVADKTPSAGRVLGEYTKFEGDSHDARMQTAKTEVEQVANDPSWTQVSFNPFRGSMYFERSTGRPIKGGSEAIVMGSLVYVKDPQYTTKEDAQYEVKGFKDAEGKPVKFQKGQAIKKQNVSDIDAIIDRTDGKEAKKALNTVKNVVNALAKVAPNQEVVVHENEASYLEAVGQGGKNTSGALDGEGKIHLNMDRAKSNTILHEATHVVIAAYLKSNPKAISEFKLQLEEIIKKSDFDAFKKLKIFELAYLKDGKQTMDEEFVVEALATIANGDIKLSKSSLDKLIELIKELAKKVGLDPNSIKLTGRENAVEFASKISEAFNEGKELDVETTKPLEEQEQGGSGDAGTIKLQKGKPLKAPSIKEDQRPFASLIKDRDIRDFNGRNFVTNMYDFTTAGEVDLGNGNTISLFGGKSYVPYMMHKKGLKIGDVSNLAAFNTKANAEGFVDNVKQSGADLFMPHSGTLDGSWQFQHSIFEALTNLVLDNKIVSKKALMATFNEVLTSADGKKNFNQFKERYKKSTGKSIRNFNSFKDNPTELIELLDANNNYSPKLRKSLNDKLAANKKLQEAIGVKNKTDFAKRMMDPMNEGVQGGELMGVVEFDPSSFEVKKTKTGDVDHHPSFGWTVLAKIKGVFQPTEFHQSVNVTDSYTKYNKYGKSVSKPTDATLKDYELAKEGKILNPKTGKIKKAKPFEGTFEEFKEKKFDSSNVSSSAGAIPKVAKVTNIAEHKVEEGKVKFQKTAKESNLFREENKDVINVSEEYKKAKNIDSQRAKKVYELDAENSKSIADAYEAMEHNPSDPKVKEAYSALAEEVQEQYLALEKAGYKLELYEGKGEPYANSKEMLDDLRNNKRLYTLSTESDFGEAGVDEKLRSDNPMLNYSSSNDINGKPLLINDLFRFVHDVFGHGEQGTSFGAIGEENAWMVHSTLFSENARRALTTETRGQNSWVNFGNHMRNSDGSIKNKGDEGYLTAMERPFADQKNGLLPDEFVFTDKAPKFQKGQDAADYIQGLKDYGFLNETSASELYDDLQEMGVDIDMQTVNTLRDAALGVEEKKSSQRTKGFAETVMDEPSGRKIGKPVKKGVEKESKYTPKKMTTTELEAEQIMKDLDVDEAYDLFLDPKSDLAEDVRVVLGQKLILKHNSLARESKDSKQKRRMHDKAITVANSLAEFHLRMGRANNAAKIYFSLSPEGQLLAIQKAVGKKRSQAFKKDADYLNTLEDIIKSANKEAIEEIIKSPKVKKAIESMYGKASKREGGTSKKSNKRKKRIVNQAVDFLDTLKIDTSGKAYDATYAIPASIWNGAISTIQVSLKAGLAISEAIDKAVDYVNSKNKGAWDEDAFRRDMDVKMNKFTALNKINEGDYAGGVRKGLKELSTDLNEIVRSHYTNQNKTKKALVDKFINELGLTESEAISVAKEIEKAFEDLATKKKKQELNKLLAPKTIVDPKKRKAKKELHDEIIQMSNMGALDGEEIRQSYAEKMGLPTITDAQAQEIMNLADLAQKAKGAIAKNKAEKNLLSYQRKLDWKNKGWLGINWGKLKDVGVSMWYANMLSGVTTQSINVWANTFETMGEMWISVLQDPRNTSFIMKGLLKGYRKGASESMGILSTKYGSVKGGAKLEVPNVLEDFKFYDLKVKGKTVIPNPYNLLKYVGRVMDAADTFFYHGLREARLHQLAAVEARKQGKDKPTAKTFELASEILFNTKENKAEATEQVLEEGYKKGTNAFRRRLNEVLDEKVDSNFAEDANDFAAKGTFNYDPEGTLGVISNTINALIAKIPVLRAIIPFTRILANVSNKYMDWTPIGALRMVKGGVGWGSYKKEYSKDERARIALKFISGTAGMISLLLLDDGEDDDGYFEITADGYGNYQKNYELSDEKGWQEHSIRIGKTWYSYKNTPLAMPFAMVGYWRDAKRYHGKTDDELTLTTPMAGMIQYTMSFSFMQGIADFMGILSKKGEGEGGMVSGLEKFFVRSSKSLVVPNIVNQSNRLYLEASSQPMKKPEKWYQQYYKDIPYFNDDMGIIYNSFGEEVIPDLSNRLIPFNAKSAQQDKAYELLHKNGIFVGAPTKTITIDGVKRKLEPKEYSKYGMKSGKMIKKMILEDYEYLKKLPADEFKTEIQSIKSYAREEARYELFLKK